MAMLQDKDTTGSLSGGWEEPRATAVLVLQDGTVLEGFGIGATGEATGEVCFNTSMTGYQEILTDPSYAGQIITFTFPHIGNVGTNEEDIESVNAASSSGVRGAVLAAAITEPSNWRASRDLDAWLKARSIVGLTGIDTRALTTLIRDRGMPNAVIAHDPEGRFDLEALKARAAALPAMDGLDLVPLVTSTQRFGWDETPWHRGEGYGHQTGEARRHVVAIDYGVKRNILRLLARAGCKITVVPATATAEDVLALKPDGVFLSNGPGDPAATGEYAVPVIQRVLAEKIPTFGICLGPPDARPGGGREDQKDAPGPPWGQPSGEGQDHRQGRDHLHEPRLRGGPRDPAGERPGDPRLPVRRLQLRHRAHRPPGLLVQYHRRPRRARRTAITSSTGS
jgi:carbamoyl-phosphate synthase small subunit